MDKLPSYLRQIPLWISTVSTGTKIFVFLKKTAADPPQLQRLGLVTSFFPRLKSLSK